MFDINEETIKYWADNRTYKIAEKMFQDGNVKKINTMKSYNRDFKFNETKINSTVKDNEDEFLTTIVFNDKTGVTSVNCKCEGFRNYYLNERICPHVAASMFKYVRDRGSVTSVNVYSMKVQKLLDDIKLGMVKKNGPTTPLNMEVKFESQLWSNRGSSIELKIGEKKLYVVKNMKEFLMALITKNSEIEFGKGFTFNPSVHYFNEEDNKIIDFLKEIYEDDKRNLSLNPNTNINDRVLYMKKAYLTDVKVKRFFKLISERAINFVIKGENYKDVKIVDENVPLDFNLVEKDDVIKVVNETKMPYPLTQDASYLFYKGFIYKIDEDERRIFIPFYNAFLREKQNSIEFAKEDSEIIASYILPGLKKISRNINIDKNLEDRFYEETLVPKIYIDRSDDMLMATIKFCYGKIQINPLRKEQMRSGTSILVRDVDTELSIVNLFKQYEFQKYGDDFINNDEENIYDFLYEGISKIQDKCEIYYSSAFKNFRVYSPASYIGGIRLNDSDLLEFNFKIEGVDKSELKNIFEALKQKKKYYRLKKGGIVPLKTEELNDVNSMINYLNIDSSQLEKESIIVPKYNSLYIDEKIKNFKMDYFTQNKGFKDLVNNVKDVQKSDFSLPSDLENIMRKYQKIGFKWLKSMAECGFGGILADEMGLGKTIQIIALLASEKLENRGDVSIVITPTSLVYNWYLEIQKFYPKLNVLIINGQKQGREELIKEYKNYDVLITSYPLIRRDIKNYKDIEFNYCILDEAQQIKNPNSVNAKSVKEIIAKNYFALTGTPIENSLTELWSIFDFIMPGYLFSHSKFVKNYEMPIIKSNDKEALKELNNHARPFILRRLKSEVIKELPPKIEHKVIVDMSDEQKKIYLSYLENAKDEIDRNIKEKGFNKSKLIILSVLTRLRQICCDPNVFIDNYEGENGKFMALDDIIENSISSDHRILLFSQFTSVLKNISAHLDKKKIDHMYFDGQTKMEERSRMVKEFNDGRGKVFLISLKAGGTGINLTGADIVIHFDPWWNPAVEEQASDRAHRIGQKKTVEVIKLITRGTIEEKIYEIQEKKKKIINDVMNMDNIDESFILKMDEEDIRNIFSTK